MWIEISKNQETVMFNLENSMISKIDDNFDEDGESYILKINYTYFSFDKNKRDIYYKILKNFIEDTPKSGFINLDEFYEEYFTDSSKLCSN